MSPRDAASLAPPPQPGLRLIAVLIVATAIGPMAMQIFIPALPAIQDAFAVHPATAQLAFSLSAFSIAFSTLIYGPIADRYGRRPAMIGGLVVFLVGSVVCAVASNIHWLIVGRIVQAAGGCAGLVLSRTIVRDLYSREQSATMLAYITMAMVLAPTLAPAIGGVIVDSAGWRMIFLFGGVIGIVVLLAVIGDLRETAPRGTLGQGSVGMVRAFSCLLREPSFRAYAFNVSCSIAVFYAFLAGAPYLMVRVMGRPASEYGLMFVLISGAFMVGNFAAARLSPRLGTDRMILIGSAGSFLATMTLFAVVLADGLSSWTLFLPMSCAAFAQGLSIPNAQAAVVSTAPHMAGSASGLAGFLQMGLAAVAAQIVGSIQNGTAWPMAVGMGVAAALALLAAIQAIRRRKSA